MNILIENVSWLFSYRVIRLTLAFFITAWVARYLTPEVYGQHGVALAEMCMLFWSQGLKEVVIKKIRKQKVDDGVISSASFQLMFVGNLLLYGLLGIILYILQIPSLIKSISLICGFGILFRSFEGFELWFHSKLQVKYTVRVQLIAQLLYMSSNVVLILSSYEAIWFAITYSIQLVITGIGFLVVFSKYLKPKIFGIFTTVQKNILLEGKFLILAKLAFTCSIIIDRFIIESMLDTSSLGIYSASLKMVTIWMFVSEAISLSFIPILSSKNHNEKNPLRAKEMFGYTTSISLLLILIFAPFSEFLVEQVF